MFKKTGIFTISYAAFAAIFILCFQVQLTVALESDFSKLLVQNNNFFEDQNGFDHEPEFEESEVVEDKSTNTPQVSFFKELITPARFTLNHQFSYKPKSEKRINNRSAFRLEYSKFFGNYFFLQIDTKINVFHKSDDQAKAIETNTKEAYLQSSFGNISIMAGLQTIIWGEADGAAVTDVVSPRDNSEFVFISLEESRIAQPALVIDQYSDIGQWSVFYIPYPEYDKLPEPGTEYYEDPFPGFAIEEAADIDKDVQEYGIRFKKSFEKSDIAFMYADLIQNEYLYQASTTESLTKDKGRFKMYGLALNFGKGNFLWKGEAAFKNPQQFNNTSYKLIKKDVVDTALSVEYSRPGTYTLMIGLINKHVINWEEDMLNAKDQGSFMINWTNTYLNEDLTLSWTSNQYYPNQDWIHIAKAEYKYNDNLTFEISALFLNIKDETSLLWAYQDQDQLMLKAKYQF